MMNYREVSITDLDLRNRLIGSAETSEQLCEELSHMTIMNAEKPASGGIFSRLKSTLFSSYENQIRSPYVASCLVQVFTSGVVDRHLHLCITAEGECKLLRSDANSPRAVELACVALPGSSEGYSVCSVYLGSTQGSLCVASVGGGKIVVMSVLNDKLAIAKTFSLPVTVPITSVCVFERHKQIELCVVLDSRDVLILPDITKPQVFSFVYLQSLKFRIKQLENSVLTDEALKVCWETRPKHTSGSDPLKVSFHFNDPDFARFKCAFALERVLETAATQGVDSERIRARLLSSEPVAELIAAEVKRLVPNLCAIQQVVRIDEKLVIFHADQTISEILPTTIPIVQYVETFQSVPIVSGLLNRRISRDSVLSYFSGSLWPQIFAAASVFESLGIVISPHAAALVEQRLASLPAEVRTHLEAVFERCPESFKNIFEEIKNLHPLTPEAISSAFYLARAYFVCCLFRRENLPPEFVSLFEKLQIAHCLTAVYGVGTLVSLDTMGTQLLRESPEIAWLGCQGKMWTNFAKFQKARYNARREPENSFAIFKETEMEVSTCFKKKSEYWEFVSESFDSSFVDIWLKLLSLEKVGTNEYSKHYAKCFENCVANGDWKNVKQLLSNSSSKDSVRLLCSEARIRGELGLVFELVRDDPAMVSFIIAEIETDLQVDKFAPPETVFENHLQIFNLAVFSKKFEKAQETMRACFGELSHENVADLAEATLRLKLQLQALILIRSLSKTDWVKNQILLTTGLRALYSFATDTEDLPPSCSPADLCRSLSALGLVILSAKIAEAFRLNFFQTCVLPFLVLLHKCESDQSFVPPCRLEATDGEDIFPSLSPGMAFVRADATGPIGTGGNQLRAMHVALAFVLAKSPVHVLVDVAAYLVNSAIPVWLTTLLEERNAWPALLALHMQAEHWKEAVFLVETHLRFWRPVDALSSFVINVPQLVQLQRALESLEPNEEVNFLTDKLRVTMDTLKETLAELEERRVVA